MSKRRLSLNTTLIRASDMPRIKPAQTRILGLDLATNGGLPRGAVTLIEGKPNTLKSTLALRAARQYMPLLFVDTDRSFNPEWFVQLGIDITNTVVAYPSSMEEAWDLLDKQVSNPEWGSIIVDSIGMLSADSELNTDFGTSSSVGIRARLTNDIMRRVAMRLTPYTTTCIIFINHLYSNIGPVPLPDQSPCGRAQHYLAHLVIRLRRTERIPADKSKPIEGIRVQWEIAKSKVGPDGRMGTFTFWIAPGIREGLELPAGTIDEAEQAELYLPTLGLMTRKGAYYSVLGSGNIQGRENLRKYLVEHMDEIYDACFREQYTDDAVLIAKHKEYIEQLAALTRPSKGTPKKQSKSSGSSIDISQLKEQLAILQAEINKDGGTQDVEAQDVEAQDAERQDYEGLDYE